MRSMVEGVGVPLPLRQSLRVCHLPQRGRVDCTYFANWHFATLQIHIGLCRSRRAEGML